MKFEFDLPGQDTRSLSEEGVWFTPSSLTGGVIGKPHNPVKLKLLGPDSDTYRRLVRAQARRRLQSAVAGGETDTFAEEEAATFEILSSCTVDWSGIQSTSGEPIPFSREAAEALYRGFPAIRDQVDGWISTRVNFTK